MPPRDPTHSKTANEWGTRASRIPAILKAVERSPVANFPLAHTGLAELPCAVNLVIEAWPAVRLRPLDRRVVRARRFSHFALRSFNPARRVECQAGLYDLSWPAPATPGHKEIR